MQAIDMNKAVVFYDDRNKCDVDYKMVDILYMDEKVCYCIAAPIVRPGSYLEKELTTAEDSTEAANENIADPWWKRIGREHILFSMEDGEVLTKNLDSWMATNDVSINGRYDDNAHAMPELNVEV